MTCEELLAIIQKRAEELHGDRWFAELVKGYVRIAKHHGDDTATVIRRRPQLQRAFDRGSCTVDTLLNLMDAVGLEIRVIAVTREDVTP